MYQGVESKSHYLALALASRTMINSLLNFQTAGVPDQQLEHAINDVLESLNANHDVNNLFGAPPKESPFAHYEQLLTLQEVTKTLKNQDIIQKLGNLFTTNQEERQKNVSQAVDFFFTLETRALHHYSQQVGSREV